MLGAVRRRHANAHGASLTSHCPVLPACRVCVVQLARLVPAERGLPLVRVVCCCVLQCTNPTPLDGGTACTGVTEEVRLELFACPVLACRAGAPDSAVLCTFLPRLQTTDFPIRSRSSAWSCFVCSARTGLQHERVRPGHGRRLVSVLGLLQVLRRRIEGEYRSNAILGCLAQFMIRFCLAVL